MHLFMMLYIELFYDKMEHYGIRCLTQMQLHSPLYL